MNIARVSSWISLLTDWKNPLSRFNREALLTILFQNSLEFRVAVLNYQIKQIMLKYL